MMNLRIRMCRSLPPVCIPMSMSGRPLCMNLVSSCIPPHFSLQGFRLFLFLVTVMSSPPQNQSSCPFMSTKIDMSTFKTPFRGVAQFIAEQQLDPLPDCAAAILPTSRDMWAHIAAYISQFLVSQGINQDGPLMTIMMNKMREAKVEYNQHIVNTYGTINGVPITQAIIKMFDPLRSSGDMTPPCVTPSAPQEQNDEEDEDQGQEQEEENQHME